MSSKQKINNALLAQLNNLRALPHTRELALTITKVEEALLWLEKSIQIDNQSDQ